MSELERGTDRAGRRGKRFLSPSQKYEIWLQLVRQACVSAGTTLTSYKGRYMLRDETFERLVESLRQESAMAVLSAIAYWLAIAGREIYRGTDAPDYVVGFDCQGTVGTARRRP